MIYVILLLRTYLKLLFIEHYEREFPILLHHPKNILSLHTF